LVGKPKAFWRRGALPEDIDRHSAARIPVATDPQPLRFHFGHQALADADRHILVKAAMVAK
jgi:hypothetical protein